MRGRQLRTAFDLGPQTLPHSGQFRHLLTVAITSSYLWPTTFTFLIMLCIPSRTVRFVERRAAEENFAASLATCLFGPRLICPRCDALNDNAILETQSVIARLVNLSHDHQVEPLPADDIPYDLLLSFALMVAPSTPPFSSSSMQKSISNDS